MAREEGDLKEGDRVLQLTLKQIRTLKGAYRVVDVKNEQIVKSACIHVWYCEM